MREIAEGIIRRKNKRLMESAADNGLLTDIVDFLNDEDAEDEGDLWVELRALLKKQYGASESEIEDFMDRDDWRDVSSAKELKANIDKFFK